MSRSPVRLAISSEQELWPPPYLGTARAVPEYTSFYFSVPCRRFFVLCKVPLSLFFCTLPPLFCVLAGTFSFSLCTLPPVFRAVQVPTFTRLIYRQFLFEVHPSCTPFSTASVTPANYRPTHGRLSHSLQTQKRNRKKRIFGRHSNLEDKGLLFLADSHA